MGSKYRTAPVEQKGMPKGIPYIVSNECAERFSYYGMQGILVIFMTQFLTNSAGEIDTISQVKAQEVFHFWSAAVWGMPLFGAIVADWLLGKYMTIMTFSFVYIGGHLSLALMGVPGANQVVAPFTFLVIGLILIAFGTGGIKACVSSHVGDQFGQINQQLLERVYSWFYFSINLGSAASLVVTPILLHNAGVDWAFGVPGILMALATLIFWLGRKKYAHIPPGGLGFIHEALSGEGLKRTAAICLIFIFGIPFWSLYMQIGSAWIGQAQLLDCHWLGMEWYPSQVQFINPILILLLIPLFSYVVYPAVGKVIKVTPLRKIAVGFFVMAFAFVISALIEEGIDGGQVVECTTQSKDQLWSKDNLLKGDKEGLGWRSGQLAKVPEGFNKDIVIRLREYRDWTIDKVQINPVPQGVDKKAIAVPTSDYVNKVDIFVGDSPSEMSWTKVATHTLKPEDTYQNIEFKPTSASYVIVRVLSNNGGLTDVIGRVRVLTTAPVTEDQSSDAKAIWPDVASVGSPPSIAWQFLAYLFLTIAEILVSITALQVAYTQAPPKMKSFIMSLWYLAVAFGNLFTALISQFIQRDDGTLLLPGASYYWFFVIIMLVDAVCFIPMLFFYKPKSYMQGAKPIDRELRQQPRESIDE